ncbi:imidazole glycerol phosphate synthase subunit HisF [Mobilitalea sibirica]|uniref:Imidazole glycerol phosphate synthase subunit HisF n=1 Tax=Mobilitalea sibirica TaxID=1462919 RepID=A0A8J7KX39_9FIRM|nr:AglZ/HisF2 family acetamidino modification protein [Mobilitalea sibirica]MBH1942055.1 imidazole glycerol phosphate synthase subunit HisF [Mobilitalea sibirica]
MYNRPRVIPCLLLKDQGLVKTIKFTSPNYLGDPINAVKIFNEKGVDELCLLDITASREGKGPDFDFLLSIATEAFMPMSYGGGITSFEQIKKLFYIGFEKVILNTALIRNPSLISEASKYVGKQSIVASIDVKTELLGKKYCYILDGTERIKINPIDLAKNAEQLGAGEILINSINNDGTMQGYDIELIKQVSNSVSIPVIACGGASNVTDIKRVLTEGEAHAAAAGSMFVYFGKKKAVLINFPSEQEFIAEGVYSNE